jgi:hypothetical protein
MPTIPDHPPTPGPLLDACAGLDRRAGQTGRAVLQVQTGTIVLDRSNPELWRLAIGCVGVWPSGDECTQIASLLGVPDDIQRNYDEKRSGYRVVEYLWTPDGSPVEQPIQPPLAEGLAPLRPIQADKNVPIEQRFRLFHAANPQVYGELRRMAISLVRAERKHFGIKMLWENLRYSYTVATHDDPYKLNNIYTSHYARLLMEREPELAGVFETRDLRA